MTNIFIFETSPNTKLKEKKVEGTGHIMSPLPEKVGGTHPPCPPPNCAHANNAYHFNFYVLVPVACFWSLVLTLKKHFVCLVFFVFFLGFIEGKFWGFSSYQSDNTGCQIVPKLANIAKHSCFPKILPIFVNAKNLPFSKYQLWLLILTKFIKLIPKLLKIKLR